MIAGSVRGSIALLDRRTQSRFLESVNAIASPTSLFGICYPMTRRRQPDIRPAVASTSLVLNHRWPWAAVM